MILAMVGEAEVVARRVERVEEGKVLLCFRIFCNFVLPQVLSAFFNKIGFFVG